VAEVCGPKGNHNPARQAVGPDSEAGSVTLGGRRVQIGALSGRSCDYSLATPVRSPAAWAPRSGRSMLPASVACSCSARCRELMLCGGRTHL
jgi:hypothetical protein